MSGLNVGLERQIAMAVCLITKKCVADRDSQKVSRRCRTNFLKSSENAVATDDDEVTYLKRGIFIMLLIGLLPLFLFLYLHIFFPRLLLVDITPKEDFTSKPQAIDSSIHYQPRIAAHE